MPKVSIIVPVFNVEKYLEECVKSLRNQTLQDIEIILVDDESPDNCPAMCERYAELDNRIKVLHKKNGGLGFARNSGLEVATGEYVTFTDRDDYELPETYETLYKQAKESQSDVVYYSFINRHVSAIEEKCYEGAERIRGLLLDMVSNPPQDVSDHDIQVSSCLAMYRRQLLERHHLRFHSERELISEDLIFNLDVLTVAQKIAVTNYKFYYYRVTNNSLTQKVRLDRHQKNKQFYLYLNERLRELDYGEDGWLRCTRLFIGYTRSTILQMCKSTLPYCDKRRWVIVVCEDDVWRIVSKRYPYKLLPLKYHLFFEFIIRRMFLPIWLLSKVS